MADLVKQQCGGKACKEEIVKMSENARLPNCATTTNAPARDRKHDAARQSIEDLRARKAGDIMNARVKTISSQATIARALKTLVTWNITGLPVVKNAKFVGVITEKDILNLILRKGSQSGSVKDHMTTRTTTFAEEDNVGDVFDCLVQKHYRRVPILRSGKVAGIISRGDLIRVYLEALQVPPAMEPTCSVADGPTAREVMTLGLLTVRPHTSVLEAMSLIVAHGITGLPVVDDNLDLVGMVSEKDLLSLFRDPHVWSRRVGDLMSYDVTAAAVSTPMLDVCECLANSGFRRVPVVERGKLVGIVSRSDLIMFILKNPSVISSYTAVGAGGAAR
jgi:CBS domain-containing protein